MYASDADYWIRPRPNSDGILAMGFVKVLVEEGLFDEKYLKKWTIGFDEVKKEVSRFSLDEVEQLAGCPSTPSSRSPDFTGLRNPA